MLHHFMDTHSQKHTWKRKVDEAAKETSNNNNTPKI